MARGKECITPSLTLETTLYALHTVRTTTNGVQLLLQLKEHDSEHHSMQQGHIVGVATYLDAYVDICNLGEHSGLLRVKPLLLEGGLATPLTPKNVDGEEGSDDHTPSGHASS